MNYTKKSWINPKVKIRNSATEGKGLYAKGDIKKGEKVLEFGGLYTDKEKAVKAKATGKLIMQWDDELFSVEDRGDDDTYFVNHSCNSNCWMSGPYSLEAKKNIKSREEITADYALWEADENFISKWNCNCGSSICRGNVKGVDWKNPKVQNLYKNHFSSLINKRISIFGK